MIWKRWSRSPSAVALTLTAALALVQALLFAALVGAQRDAAHLIDISGLQRMQTQRIAFLALAARDGSAAPGWQTEFANAISATAAGRAELARVFAPNLAADAEAARYLGAARTIERDPKGDPAYETIRRLRIPLMRQADAAVKHRVALLKARNDGLSKAMMAGAAIELVVIALCWMGLAAPAERRISGLLSEITEQQEHIRSLFDENPDGIAVYDERGHLVRVNRARAVLGGHHGTRYLGRHYTSFVAPDSGNGPNAFERAAAGETVVKETLLRSESGVLIDVRLTMFPNIVRGRRSGVIVVSKDIREIKRAERLYAEQSERLADLYAIAAAHGKSMRGRIADALALAARQLGYEWAAATEIAGGKSTVVATFGDSGGLAMRAHEGLHRSILNHLANADDVWSVDDFASAPWLRGATGGTFRSMTGMRIEADDVLYGVVAFASEAARPAALSANDKHFLRLVSALLGSIIERDQRERKLDSLAFFDALTGLPNRVLLLDRLEERVTAASRRNVHFGVLYVDLDRFKAVNDGSGHSAGDAVLRTVATRLQRCVRDTDTVARLSGDEFVILKSSTEGMDDFAHRIVAALGEPIPFKDGMHVVGASVGIALFPQDGESPMDLLAAADAALYHAKRNGRNRFAYANAPDPEPIGVVTPLHAKTSRRRALRA